MVKLETIVNRQQKLSLLYKDSTEPPAASGGSVSTPVPQAKDYNEWKDQLLVKPEKLQTNTGPLSRWTVSHPSSKASVTINESKLDPGTFVSNITKYNGGQGGTLRHDNHDLAMEDAKVALYHELNGRLPHTGQPMSEGQAFRIKEQNGLTRKRAGLPPLVPEAHWRQPVTTALDKPIYPLVDIPSRKSLRDVDANSDQPEWPRWDDGHGGYLGAPGGSQGTLEDWALRGDRVSWDGPLGHAKTGTVVKNSNINSDQVIIEGTDGHEHVVAKNRLHIHSLADGSHQVGPTGDHLPLPVPPPNSVFNRKRARSNVRFERDGSLSYVHANGAKPGDKVNIGTHIGWGGIWRTSGSGKVVGPVAGDDRNFLNLAGENPDHFIRVRKDGDDYDTNHHIDNLRFTHLPDGTPVNKPIERGSQVNVDGNPATVVLVGSGGTGGHALVQFANGNEKAVRLSNLERARRIPLVSTWAPNPIDRFVPSIHPGTLPGATSGDAVWQHDFEPVRNYSEFNDRMSKAMPFTELDPSLQQFNQFQLNDLLARAEHLQNTYGITRHPSVIRTFNPEETAANTDPATGEATTLGLHQRPKMILPSGHFVGSPIILHPNYDFSRGGGRHSTQSLGDTYAHELFHEIHEHWNDSARRPLLGRLGGLRPRDEIHSHLGPYAADMDGHIDAERPTHGISTGGGHEYFAELGSLATRPGWRRGHNLYEDEFHKLMTERGLFR